MKAPAEDSRAGIVGSGDGVDVGLEDLRQDLLLHKMEVTMQAQYLCVLCAKSFQSVRLCDPMNSRLLGPWDSPGKNTAVGCYFLLQGIFLTQGSNLGLPHCTQILYHLSYLGSLILYINKVKHVKPLALGLV